MSDYQSVVDREIPQGYLDIKPRPESLMVTNLINFAEPRGAYGETSSSLRRILTSGLILLAYLVVLGALFVWLGFWAGIILLLLTFWVPLRLVSLFVFNELKVKKEYKSRQGRVRRVQPSELIDFYAIDDEYPYIIRYIDGSIGILVQLVRRAQVGSAEKRAFEHAEALSDFYNFLMVSGIHVDNFDIQSLSVRDSRFDVLQEHLGTIKNETLQKVMASVYAHLEEASSNTSLSYEYILLSGHLTDDALLDAVQEATMMLTPTYYKRLDILPSSTVSSVIAALYGLKSFPIEEAMSAVAERIGSSSFTVLWLENHEGKRKVLAKSLSEREAELASVSKSFSFGRKKKAKDGSVPEPSNSSVVSNDSAGSVAFNPFGDDGVENDGGLTSYLGGDVVPEEPVVIDEGVFGSPSSPVQPVSVQSIDVFGDTGASEPSSSGVSSGVSESLDVFGD